MADVKHVESLLQIIKSIVKKKVKLVDERYWRLTRGILIHCCLYDDPDLKEYEFQLRITRGESNIEIGVLDGPKIAICIRLLIDQHILTIHGIEKWIMKNSL